MVQLKHISIGICTNRIEFLLKQIDEISDDLNYMVLFMFVLDGISGKEQLEKLCNIKGIYYKIWVNEETMGLSKSRNILLSQCQSEYLIFMDDDVIVTNAAILEMNKAIQQGFNIIGARLVLPEKTLLPWFISEGQYHYIGIHSYRNIKIVTWGAFMGVNISLAKKYKVIFEKKLGRKGSNLQSGEDTTFIRNLKRIGLKEYTLSTEEITHCISTKKLTWTYLIRRAWWQGRTEVKRNCIFSGILKEFIRNFKVSFSMKNLFLASMYFFSVLSGILYELVKK